MPINFSAIRDSGPIGKCLRLPLKLIPSYWQIPILQGPLWGQRWIVGSSTHGCWLGSYELDKCKLIEATLKPGDIFYDIGAHVGYYTLLAAKLVSQQGKVYAFEPFSQNANYLRKHVKINQVQNVIVHQVAVSNYDGTAKFKIGGNSSEGSLNSTGELEIGVVSLDKFMKQHQLLSPTIIKIDVEGEELHVLQGAENTLNYGNPTVFLATHNNHIHKACLQFLRKCGFSTKSLTNQPVEQSDEIVAWKA